MQFSLLLSAATILFALSSPHGQKPGGTFGDGCDSSQSSCCKKMFENIHISLDAQFSQLLSTATTLFALPSQRSEGPEELLGMVAIRPNQYVAKKCLKIFIFHLMHSFPCCSLLPPPFLPCLASGLKAQGNFQGWLRFVPINMLQKIFENIHISQSLDSQFSLLLSAATTLFALPSQWSEGPAEHLGMVGNHPNQYVAKKIFEIIATQRW